MQMKTALVLSTYNGSCYIEEQLDSIQQQTRSVDCVAIRDDCSTDGTPTIVERYIRDHALYSWSFCKNNRNQGWKKNFHELIVSTDGDIIFLCDQDDIWLSNKIEEMATIMETNEDVDVLACSVSPFYESGSEKVSGEKEMARESSGRLRYQKVDNKSVYVQRPGCSYCVRRSFVTQIEPYWNDEWAHDAILWILAEVKGSLALYDRALVRFRRHEGNASAREKMTRVRRLEDLNHLIERIDLMERFGNDFGYLTPDKTAELEDMRFWLEARIRFLQKCRISDLLETIAGREHYLTSKGFPVDAALAVFRNAVL